MNEIAYVGEHLFIGKAGHFFTILSFTAALVASLSYFFATQANELSQTWKNLARKAFYVHALAVIGIIETLFVMLLNHYYEYQYVWQHSNNSMPMQYILSCFWEGQEGSFLLWSFWHVVLGLVMIRTSGEWEPYTMSVFSLVQVFLATMLLGVYIAGTKIGSSPFLLLREHPEFANLPFVQSANYLEKLDGRGLNPLLQNYWMTIHPPTLFLGFASTLIPFCYAIAGVWRRKIREWVSPALAWTYFSVMILGLGILMGGAWAYEALSFGGFWAWDPVENASLVPWLTLVGAAHVMLIVKNRGESLVSAVFLSIITFVLILYSTFLTRSGVLGDTSVHAFTDLGMSGQLLIYLLFFTILPTYFSFKTDRNRWLFAGLAVLLLAVNLIAGFQKVSNLAFTLASLIMLVVNLNSQYKQEKEEDITSREFWMFIGSLILALAAFQIIISTSTPVFNRIIRGTFLVDMFQWLHQTTGVSLFEKAAQADMATPKDVIEHYNSWQVPFAAITAFLIAIGQFLKYKKSDKGAFFKKLTISFAASLIITLGVAIGFNIKQPALIFLLFTANFAICANFDYFTRVLKGKVLKSGASIAHIGFALVLGGSLISAGKKEFISKNMSGIDLGKDFPNTENVLLAKNNPMPMGDYYAVFRGDSTSGINIYYKVDYLKKNADGSQGEKLFSLYPLVQTNPRMGNVAEPATKHYLHKDVFTHVTYAKLDQNQAEVDAEGFGKPEQKWVHPGDTVYTSNSFLIIEEFTKVTDYASLDLKPDAIAMKIRIRVMDIKGGNYFAEPIFYIDENAKKSKAAEVKELGLRLGAVDVKPEENAVMLVIQETPNRENDFIILKAIVFPGINLLWLGSVLLVLGSFVAIVERIKRRRIQTT